VKSEEIAARAERYNRVEREADVLNRIIGIRRLKPSEEMRITGMTADLDGFEQATGEDGNPVKIAKRAPFIVAAMVCEVEGIPFTFPRTRGELDAVYDRLDREGIEAAMRAYIRLEGGGEAATADQPAPPSPPIVDEAKN
jgi:hypothetical protein